MLTATDIKSRLLRTKKKQIDLVKTLRERGYNASPATVSKAINYPIQPNEFKFNELIGEIIGEWEKEGQS